MNFICPVCKKELSETGNALKCENSHLYDLSKYRYVNLLLGNSGVHGDNKEMVLARNAFLAGGFYSFLREALCSEVCRHDISVYLDSGCGEGYYTEKIADEIKKAEIFGVDISKDALRIAARRVSRAKLAVASVYSMPFADNSFDLITSVFSPFAHDEFRRVLKGGGILIQVIPGKYHLYGLKALIYDNPYENEIKPYEEDGFEFLSSVKTEKEAILDADTANMLWKMTPYYYRTSKSGLERLANAVKVKTMFDFEILTYRNIKKKAE